MKRVAVPRGADRLLKVKPYALACCVLVGLLLAVENVHVVWAASQDDDAGYWTDTFTDETGITMAISTTVDAIAGQVVLDAMRLYAQTDWSGGAGLEASAETTNRYFSGEGLDETIAGALSLGYTVRADSPMADLNGDGYLDLVISSHYDDDSGSYATDSYIYYGSADGYNTTNRTGLPTYAVTGSTVADLNHDGYVDIVFCQFTASGSLIYWGSAEGYSTANRTVLSVANAVACSVADLNQDGYLDLVLAVIMNASNNFLTPSYVYWGSATGFSDANRLALPTAGAMSGFVADLDQDGYLDIIFANYRNNGEPYAASTYEISSYIYWGSATGYSVGYRTSLPTVGAHGSSVADLNGDGYLDIVFSNRHTANGSANVYAVDSYIYWGSENGRAYGTANRTLLPTVGAFGNSLADLDGNGYRDIIFSNHQSAPSTHAVDSYIYWGSEAGYRTGDRTDLPTVGAAGTAVGDLNNDGYLDIALANRRNGNQHNIDSYIYWGSAAGYSTSDRSDLPTHGAMGIAVVGSPIICANTALGNVYAQPIGGDVSLEDSMWTPRIYPSTGVLTSAAFDGGSTHTWKRAVWHASVPSGTDLRVEAATSDDGSTWSEWQAVGSGSVDGTNDAVLNLSSSRYLRYRVTLQGAADHRSTPTLYDLSFWGDFSVSGSVTSVTVPPALLIYWDEVVWNRVVGTGQAITVQILDADGTLLPDAVLPGNSSGFSTSPVGLSEIDPVVYTSLRLRATLSRSEEMATPELQEWTLSWATYPTAVDLVCFEANPQGAAIYLTWETAIEYDTLGFYLYRADAADGLLHRLNENLVATQLGDGLAGALYAYRDETATPGVTHYYWLEEVNNHGLATRYGPVSARIEENSPYRLFLPLVRR